MMISLSGSRVFNEISPETKMLDRIEVEYLRASSPLVFLQSIEIASKSSVAEQSSSSSPNGVAALSPVLYSFNRLFFLLDSFVVVALPAQREESK